MQSAIYNVNMCFTRRAFAIPSLKIQHAFVESGVHGLERRAQENPYTIEI